MREGACCRIVLTEPPPESKWLLRPKTNAPKPSSVPAPEEMQRALVYLSGAASLKKFVVGHSQTEYMVGVDNVTINIDLM